MSRPASILTREQNFLVSDSAHGDAAMEDECDTTTRVNVKLCLGKNIDLGVEDAAAKTMVQSLGTSTKSQNLFTTCATHHDVNNRGEIHSDGLSLRPHYRKSQSQICANCYAYDYHWNKKPFHTLPCPNSNFLNYEDRLISLQDNWPKTKSQTPENMAAAGWYYAYDPLKPDLVRTKCCDLSVYQWMPGENPFRVHAENSRMWNRKTCKWILTNRQDLSEKEAAELMKLEK